MGHRVWRYSRNSFSVCSPSATSSSSIMQSSFVSNRCGDVLSGSLPLQPLTKTIQHSIPKMKPFPPHSLSHLHRKAGAGKCDQNIVYLLRAQHEFTKFTIHYHIYSFSFCIIALSVSLYSFILNLRKQIF